VTGAGRADLAREELANAEEELRAADALLASGFPRVAITRAYFAVFHLARAVLFAHDLAPKSHKGVLHLINRDFVRTGKISVADARLLSQLQEYRSQADYGGFYIGDEATARADVISAKALCDRFKALLPPG
jgi:uncharacterized protein